MGVARCGQRVHTRASFVCDSQLYENVVLLLIVKFVASVMPFLNKKQRAGKLNREARNVPVENAAPTAAAGPSSLDADVSFIDV